MLQAIRTWWRTSQTRFLDAWLWGVFPPMCVAYGVRQDWIGLTTWVLIGWLFWITRQLARVMDRPHICPYRLTLRELRQLVAGKEVVVRDLSNKVTLVLSMEKPSSSGTR